MNDASPPHGTNEMTGGEALARMLKAYGVGPIFGMGGFQLLPFYDACRRLGLRHTLINDERCGAFAADAYARTTGRVGVCDATLGPGATNLVTALVESLNAGVPVLAITGDTNRAHSWKNMTQESRQLDILAPAAKEVIRVESVERMPELVRRAFAVATSGRAGPVVLDVPEDVSHATHDFGDDAFFIDPATQAIPAIRCRPAADAVAEAADLIAGAVRPMILAGGGVHLSGAQAELQAFAEALNIPVAHTLSGKGSIACTHRLSAGIFGRYSRIANDMIEKADVFLVVGCKLGEIATKRYTVPPAGRTVIHLDVLPEEFGRCYPHTVALWGDARDGVRELKSALDSRAHVLKAKFGPWSEEVTPRMAKWREEVKGKLTSNETPITMARLMTEINGVLPADGILVADGGFAAHWGGLLFDTKAPGRTFVPDRGFASIGYGVPGAMGCALGTSAPVLALTGDGGFNMTLGELETARRLGLGFTMIIVNNAASGYVKALQHLMYGKDAYQSSDLVEMDYANIARGMGCGGIRVDDPAELANALRQGMAETDRPTVVDVVVTRDPAHMLPGVDNRTVQIKKGDRVA